MSITTGWTAALDAWRGDTADTAATRNTRYRQLWSFYLNDPYDELVNDLAQDYKANRDLYIATQPLYNPVTRLVDFYVAKIVGGILDPTGESGALPLEGDPAIIKSINQIWTWSSWATRKNLWVRYGAGLGDSVIKIVENRVAKTVALQLHWPGDLVDADFDRNGALTYAKFEYNAPERDANGDIETYTYTETITPDLFATYRDDAPHDYVNNIANGELATWPNEFGFVPVVLTRHKDAGHAWGLCAYHNGLPKIDNLNDLASHLGDQIRKAIRPQWVSYGSRTGSGLDRSDKIWHHPTPDGRIEALVEKINIADVTTEIAARLREIEQDFPELKVYHLSSQHDLSGRAVQFLLGDAQDRVIEARGQYDTALVQANQYALRIGAHRNYWPGNLATEFTHTIADRDIFPVDETEQLHLESLRLAIDAQRAALTEPYAG